MRHWGALNVLLGASQLWLTWSVVPSRALWVEWSGVAVALLWLSSGLGLLVGGRGGRWLARVACGAALAFGVTLCLLLVASFGYLSAIYGAVGRLLAWGAVVAGGLVLLGTALPALLELRALAEADGDERPSGARTPASGGR
jgi:hypothetical protein